MQLKSVLEQKIHVVNFSAWYVMGIDANVYIQGVPAKVRPTYIFDGNIWMHR